MRPPISLYLKTLFLAALCHDEADAIHPCRCKPLIPLCGGGGCGNCEKVPDAKRGDDSMKSEWGDLS